MSGPPVLSLQLVPCLPTPGSEEGRQVDLASTMDRQGYKDVVADCHAQQQCHSCSCAWDQTVRLLLFLQVSFV